ncbi:macrophage mannose receptor 1 isoform X2, partial [Silurus asotus]
LTVVCGVTAYIPHHYHFVNENKTWSEAQTYCRDKYTDLATISNMDEMKKLNITLRKETATLAWIGLKSESVGEWKWSLADQTFYRDGDTYRNWSNTEPNNAKGKEFCVMMSRRDGSFLDENCDDKLCFVCYDEKQSTRYILVESNKTWYEAQNYCREKHTDLVSVRNHSENKEIWTVSIKDSSTCTQTENAIKYVWIGLFNDSWKWSDESNSSFRYWNPDKPRDDLKCAAVSGKGFWFSCSSQVSIVCICGVTAFIPHRYHFVNENKTWSKAQTYCRDKYTDLATISNMDEMKKLNITLKKETVSLAWIGLKNESVGEWKWSLADQTFYRDGDTYRNWSSAEPNNDKGKEFCVMMSRSSGSFLDENCDDKLCFVCYDEKQSTRYILVESNKTWYEAQNYCREKHTDLVSVRNHSENKEIWTVSIKNSSTCTQTSNAIKYVWIGLFNDSWKWSDQSKSSFRYWNPDKPSNDLECAAVSGSEEHYWNNVSCTEQLPFICHEVCGVTAFIPHRYHFVNENKNWSKAQTYCRDKYTDLATISNMDEMKKLNITLKKETATLAWIGLKSESFGEWKWSLADQTFYRDGDTYRKWSNTEPNNARGKEFCVMMSRRDGSFLDENCDTTLHFVCYNEKQSNNRYVFEKSNKTWRDAQTLCREKYTDLVSVRNQSENQEILNKSKEEIPLIKDYVDLYVWIGLFNDSWKWSDQSNSSFRYWNPDKPRVDLKCAAVSGSEQHYWNNVSCTEQLPFICHEVCGVTAYIPHRYHFVNENKIWSNAQTYCRDKYTDLATISNMDEMEKLNITLKNETAKLAWIGLKRESVGEWKWSLADQTFYRDGDTYRNWSSGEPNNQGGNERCVMMSRSSGSWLDEKCDKKLCFVCYDGKNTNSSKYILINESKKTWYEAQTFCREKYTDLVSVRNPSENEEIWTVSIKNPSTCTQTSNAIDNVWIGLFNDSWKWSDQSNSSFRYWSSDKLRDDLKCAAVSGSEQHYWNNVNCKEQLPFICH